VYIRLAETGVSKDVQADGREHVLIFAEFFFAMQDWYAAEAAKNEENGQNGQLKNVPRAKFERVRKGCDMLYRI